MDWSRGIQEARNLSRIDAEATEGLWGLRSSREEKWAP